MSSALTRYGTRGGTAGRPPDPRVAYYVRRFRLPAKGRIRILTWKMLEQLDRCQSDCARRLLLGVSEQWGADEEREIA
jgi:hypothetical protein